MGRAPAGGRPIPGTRLAADPEEARSYLISTLQVERFLAQVRAAFPREASGVLLGCDWRRYTLLTFVATPWEENTPRSFRIREEQIGRIAASVAGTGAQICGCAHSHGFGRACPSPRDAAAVKGQCTLWMIFSVPRRDLKLFAWEHGDFTRQRLRIVA
jgi:hypothetical protein